MQISEDEITKRYAKIYLEILMRYREYIEESESLYIAELSKLVTPDKESIVNIANDIKGKFPSYSMTENFYEAANYAFEYINENILTVVMPIQFWLYPEETVSCGAGDIFDKATLLCSIFIALGNPSAMVLTKEQPTGKLVRVYCEYNNKLIVADVEKGITVMESYDKFLESIGLGGDKQNVSAYEFNDKRYRTIV
ncbi:MAG: hypothetical protein ACP5MK_01405 [Candidatus Micrarchaeia archaeon]